MFPCDIKLSAGMDSSTRFHHFFVTHSRSLVGKNVLQVLYVVHSQLQDLNFGQFRVGRHVGKVPTELQECGIEKLGSLSFLFVGR